MTPSLTNEQTNPNTRALESFQVDEHTEVLEGGVPREGMEALLLPT